MYYPKSQIKTNLRTPGGEFTISGTNQDYKGYYYLISNGQAYSGKSPNDPISQLLLPNDQNPLKTTLQGDAESDISIALSPPLAFTLPQEYINSSKINVFFLMINQFKK
jgi:hypothetical protein